jgi:hypothetical protein
MDARDSSTEGILARGGGRVEEREGWGLYVHASDESVRYLARTRGDGNYEVKHVGADDSAAWTMPDEVFLETYRFRGRA